MDRLIATNTVPVGSGDVAPVTGTPGQATDGNPATGVPATINPAYGWNMLCEEIRNVVVAGGVTPSGGNWTQLLQALKQLFAAVISPIFQTGITVATQSNVNGTFLQAGPVHTGDFGAILVNVPTGYTALLMQLGINGTPLMHVGVDGSIGCTAGIGIGTNLGVVGTATIGGACSLGATTVNGNLVAPAVYFQSLSVNGTSTLGGRLTLGTGLSSTGGYLCTNHDFNDGTDPVLNQVQGCKIGGGGISSYPAAGAASGTFGSTGAGAAAINIYNNAAQGIGGISNNGNNSVSFNTTSDRRIKDGLEPVGFEEARDRVLALKPTHFHYTHGEQTRLQGFIADEVSSVYPYAVHGEPDALNKDGSIKPQGLDITKGLPADLVAVVQGLIGQVQDLRVELAAQKGGA